jgi:hypothetical protein
VSKRGAIVSVVPFSFPKSRPTVARTPKPGEFLFEFSTGRSRYRVELRSYGEFGTEAQFVCEGQVHFGLTLPTRRLAIAWAEAKREDMLRGSAR